MPNILMSDPDQQLMMFWLLFPNVTWREFRIRVRPATDEIFGSRKVFIPESALLVEFQCPLFGCHGHVISSQSLAALWLADCSKIRAGRLAGQWLGILVNSDRISKNGKTEWRNSAENSQSQVKNSKDNEKSLF